MAESEVGGMVAAEGAAVDSKVDTAGALMDEGKNFVKTVLLVGVVTADAVGGMDGFVVPALGVDAIDAEEHELALIETVGKGLHHQLVFVLVKAAH